MTSTEYERAERVEKVLGIFIPISLLQPPEDEIITVFCSDGEDEVGFVENTLFGELGVTMFIVKSWILQSELDKLLESTV